MQRWRGGSWVGETWTPAWEYRSRLILGQDEAGAAMTVGAVITAVIQYAASCGISISAGTIDAGPCFPWDEVVDISCADVIRRVARWCPESVGWIDYSTPVPTFNFRTRTALATRTLAVGQDINSVNLTPVGSRSVPAVVLKYEIATEVNGSMVSRLETDAYPVAATGHERGAVVQTIQLSGGSVNNVIQKQKIVSVNLPEMVINGALKAWFLARNPGYANASGLTILAVSRTRPDLLRELLEGSLQDWMRLFIPDPNNPGETMLNPDRKYEYRDAESTITFTVSYVVYDDDGVTPIRTTTDTVTTTVTVTDCPTGTYQRGSFDGVAGESKPAGLAQALYASLNAAHHRGTVVVLREEVPATTYLGSRLLVTGGDAAWASMSAVVQSVTDSIDTGQTTLQVGPPGHLTPSEILDLRRVNRTRRVADRASGRISGSAGSGTVDFASAIPKCNTGAGPSRWGVRQTFITAVRVSNNAIQAKRQSAVAAYLDAESDWETIEGGQGESCDESSP
jgi:hypothetical protein